MYVTGTKDMISPLRHFAYVKLPLISLTTFKGGNWYLLSVDEENGDMTCPCSRLAMELRFQARIEGQQSLRPSPRPWSPHWHSWALNRNPGTPKATLISKFNAFLVEAAVSCVITSVALPGPSCTQDHSGGCERTAWKIQHGLGWIKEPREGERQRTHACVHTSKKTYVCVSK